MKVPPHQQIWMKFVELVSSQSHQLKTEPPLSLSLETCKLPGVRGAMAKAAGSANVDPMDKGGIQKSTGFNPALIVLIVVLGALLIFGVGNFLLYQYAQKNAPPKKKKPVSKKKLKKERLKGGVRPAGD